MTYKSYNRNPSGIVFLGASNSDNVFNTDTNFTIGDNILNVSNIRISDDAHLDGSLYINNFQSTSGVAFFDNDGKLNRSDNFLFNSNDNQVFINGKIGLNTNPQYELDVSGSAFFSNGVYGTLNVLNNNFSQSNIIIKGAISQAANLQEWQDSTGSTLAYVDNVGNAGFKNLTVDNINVSGTFTYVNSSNVTISDKQLELGSQSGIAVGDDIFVDNGGIVLKSTEGDKEWTWKEPTDSWYSSENIAIANGKYFIFGDSTLQSTAYTGQDQVLSGVLQPQITENYNNILSISGVVNGDPSGIAFFGNDGTLSQSSSLTFSQGDNQLYVSGQVNINTDPQATGYVFSVADASGLVAIEYNNSGELRLGEFASRTTIFNNQLRNPSFTYVSGLLIRIDYENLDYKTFSYNAGGSLVSLSYTTPTFVQSKDFVYYDDGLLSGIIYT